MEKIMSKKFPDRIVQATQSLSVEINGEVINVYVENLSKEIKEQIKLMDYIRQKYADLQYDVAITENAWKETHNNVINMIKSEMTPQSEK